MNKKIQCLLLAALAVVSCEPWDDDMHGNRHVTGRGEVESETIYVDDFTKIKLQHVANVYVTVGEEQQVTFTAQENIISYMEAVVRDDELRLRFDRDINVDSDDEIRVDITVRELERISIEGVGNFEISGPAQESLDIEVKGVGNVDAVGLPVEEADVEIEGTGNVSVDVSDDLDVDIDGIGNVYYYGSPHVTQHIGGLGEVVRQN